MTEELLDLFNLQFYCPTALRLPSLDYSVGDRRVQISIVGDPIAPGSIINDGVPSGFDSQSALAPMAPPSLLFAVLRCSLLQSLIAFLLSFRCVRQLHTGECFSCQRAQFVHDKIGRQD